MNYGEARWYIEQGNVSPYDATDDWREGDRKVPPPYTDDAHAIACTIIFYLKDNSRMIEDALRTVDEDRRIGFVRDIAAIIRVGMKPGGGAS